MKGNTGKRQRGNVRQAIVMRGGIRLPFARREAGKRHGWHRTVPPVPVGQANITSAQRARPAVTEAKSSPPAIGVSGRACWSAVRKSGERALPPVR